MKIITINGIHHTGKTTTATAIIKELSKRGFSVGSIKEIHAENFAMDTIGSNTNLHQQAGASMVIARGINETDVLIPKALTLDAILDFFDHDWVVCEGVEDANALKIVTGASEADCMLKWDERVIAVSGIISNQGVATLHDVPVFHPKDDIDQLMDYLLAHVSERLPNFDETCCQACGMSCKELLVAQYKDPQHAPECVLNSSLVEVLIDNKPIKMVPFVQNIVRNNVLAILSELQGYKTSKPITITINPYEIKKK